MADAIIGFGSRFSIGSGSPLTYAAIGQAFNIQPAEKVVGTVDVTHYESPNAVREFLPTLIDGGEWQMDLHYIPAVSDTLEDLIVARELVPCQFTAPNGVRIQFMAVMTNLGRAAPIEDKVSRSVTFKVSGQESRLAAL